MTTPITKESLVDRIALLELIQRDDCITLKEEYQLNAYRLLLASLEAEPVAYMYSDAEGCEYNGHNEFSGGGKGIPLYAAPPALVVPEMAISDDMNLYQKSFAQGHNACRAAMLNHSEVDRDMVELVRTAYKLPPNSFTDDELEMMAHGDNPQDNAYRELLAFRRGTRQ